MAYGGPIKKRGRDRSIPHTAGSLKKEADSRSGRSFIIAFIVLGIAAPALAPLHPLMALLAVPFCYIVSYFLFDRISRLVFKKEFQPPSRFFREWDDERKMSDWLLWILSLVFLFALWSVFAELSDHIRHENFYKW